MSAPSCSRSRATPRSRCARSLCALASDVDRRTRAACVRPRSATPLDPPFHHPPRPQAELWAWLKSVVRDKDLTRLKKDTLTLDRAPGEVTSGFLTLVLPLLQARDDVRVRVSLRERREVRTDLRLVVEDRTRTTGHDRKAAVTQWRSYG